MQIEMHHQRVLERWPQWFICILRMAVRSCNFGSFQVCQNRSITNAKYYQLLSTTLCKNVSIGDWLKPTHIDNKIHHINSYLVLTTNQTLKTSMTSWAPADNSSKYSHYMWKFEYLRRPHGMELVQNWKSAELDWIATWWVTTDFQRFIL